jgi:hypothetical protein
MSESAFRVGDKVRVNLVPTTNKYHNLYEGWTHDYGVAVQGQTGVIESIAPHGQSGPLSIYVKFDKEVKCKGKMHQSEIKLFGFHFKENELIKIYSIDMK